MSDTTASLRRKIESAGALQSVVRTMKTIAASSVGEYEQSVRALADYYRTVELGVGACIRAGESGAWGRMKRERTEADVIGAVVFGSDQGLVGRFNNVVTDRALETFSTLARQPLVWAVGERVHGSLADAGLRVVGRFGVPRAVTAIASLVGQILVETEVDHDEGRVTELHLVYNRTVGGAAYHPVSQRLLPLDDTWRRARADHPWPTTRVPEVMGGNATTLRAFVHEYLFVSLFRACAESLASENASRLAAMQRADQNIDELLEDFTGRFHRVRQNGIDEELFDVVAGFEVLAK